LPTSAPSIEPPRAVDVLGLPVRPVDMNGLIELAVGRARARQRTTACYVNAHTANQAMRNRRLRSIYANCELLFADGASMVWASRWSTQRLPQRLTAMDYFPHMARRFAKEGLSIFILAGRPGVAERAADALKLAHPGLQIAGWHHGFFKRDESAEVIEQIRAARPDMLAIGMSTPRQEYWLAEHEEKLDVPLRWCVGALFDYYAGLEQRGPQWLCDRGLEWMARLLVDPMGKWRRYLVGNPVFVMNTLRWAMQRRRRHRPLAEAVQT